MAYATASYTLLSNAAATGNAVPWPGGRGVFVVPSGTFNGATVTLQWSLDGSTWMAVDRSGDTYCTLTAAGAGLFELPPCSVRAFISAGPPSAMVASAMGVNG